MNCRKKGSLDKKSALTAADPTTTGAVQARLGGVEFAEMTSAPTEIMWMPGGVHTITASQNGKPKKVRVTVDSGTAAVLQQALGTHLAASPQRPYFDFDHENGPASGWPVSFEWREMPQPGVYARIEWSGSGRDAVTGRSYRAFSPTFFTDDGNPARVTGAPLNMGGLVNNPAFKAIRPIWSKDRTSDSSMKATAKLLAAIAALTALRTGRAPILAKATDDTGKQALSAHDQQIEAKLAEIETLRAAVEAESASESDEGERARAQLAAKDAEIALIQAKNERLERDRLSRIEADADAAIRVAVERGAIAAQDTTTQAHWKRLLVADPSNAVLLANQPGNPAIGGAVIARNAGSGHRIEAGQADSRHALEAFGQELDPQKRGAIWAKDLRKRVEAGADFVNEVQAITRDLQAGKYAVTAANSLGTLTGVLVVQRSLDFLKLTFPILGRISTDFSAENAAFNQQISTRLRGALAVQSFNPATGYQDQDASTTDVPVTINQHKYVQISFGVNELASTMRGLFTEQEEPMHYALGKDLCDTLYALLIGGAGNFTNATTQAAVGFGRNTVVDIASTMRSRGVAGPNQTLLLNPTYFAALSKDSVLVNLATYQGAQSSLITAGTLPDISGFKPVEAINLPGTANLTGFALRPDALAMATRVPNDYTTALPGVPSTGRLQVITCPDTGMSVLLTQYIDHNFGVARGRIALMYGVARGQVASGQRIISA